MLQTEEIQGNINQVNQHHLAFAERIKNHPKVQATRVLGVIFALEIKVEGKQDYYGTLRNTLYDFFIRKGIILRPVGNIIYILPPYIINDMQLEQVYSAIEEALTLI